jgi:hypothetical protein
MVARGARGGWSIVAAGLLVIATAGCKKSPFRVVAVHASALAGAHDPSAARFARDGGVDCGSLH